QIIAILNKIKPPYNVNEHTQEKAMERILNVDYVKSEVSDILNERSRLYEALLHVKFIKKAYPSDSNFILAKVDDADKRYAQILERGVVVRNRTSQPLCENTLRFTVGTSEENEKLIEILRSLS